jgi:hypothetical protein
MGEYPYNTATVVQGPDGSDGEWNIQRLPIRGADTEKNSILRLNMNWGTTGYTAYWPATPISWMDEGINSYYDNR